MEYKGSVGLRKMFPPVKYPSLHQWWGDFTGREGRTLGRHGNGSKRSGLCYR